MNRISLLTSASATLIVLAACGGASNQTPAVPTPVPTPTPSPAGFPKDYQLPYLSPTEGIYTVPANALSSKILRSSAQPLLTTQIDDGEWTNGVVVDNRPHSLVFLDGNQWKTLSLRNTAAQTVTTTGVTEDRIVCTNFGPFVYGDYATPSASLVFYAVAGPDGGCGTIDDLVTAFRPAATGAVTLGRYLPRVFRSNTGAISGYLAQVGDELRLYAPDSSSFTVVATGIVGRVGSAANYARLADTVWLRWNNGTNISIYRIDATGAVSSPLYSVPLADFLINGIADNAAMYVSHDISGGATEIVRIPFTGTASSVATVPRGTQVIDETANSLLLISQGADSDSNGNIRHRYSVLAKSGGSPVDIGLTREDLYSFPGVQSIAGNRYALNLYGTDSTGGGTSTALLVNEQGQLVENLPNSEWFGFSSNDFDSSHTNAPTSAQAACVENYSGSLTQTGHQGGTIVLRDFAAGSRTNIGQVIAAGRFNNLYFLPSDLVAFDTSDGSNTDLFGFNLETLNFTQVTDTPIVRESIP